MKRIIIVCEGETEQRFCNNLLNKHLVSFGKLVSGVLLSKTRGGIAKWIHIKHEVERHLKSDSTCIVSTFFDYYGIQNGHDFPRFEDLNIERDVYKRLQNLESAMKQDIDSLLNYRFIPYLQLHEFEALLFCDTSKFSILPNSSNIIPQLIQIEQEFPNPELINDAVETSPSKRILKLMPRYNKVLDGNMILEEIGLDNIRRSTTRFKAWLEALENL